MVEAPNAENYNNGVEILVNSPFLRVYHVNRADRHQNMHGDRQGDLRPQGRRLRSAVFTVYSDNASDSAQAVKEVGPMHHPPPTSSFSK